MHIRSSNPRVSLRRRTWKAVVSKFIPYSQHKWNNRCKARCKPKYDSSSPFTTPLLSLNFCWLAKCSSNAVWRWLKLYSDSHNFVNTPEPHRASLLVPLQGRCPWTPEGALSGPTRNPLRYHDHISSNAESFMIMCSSRRTLCSKVASPREWSGNAADCTHHYATASISSVTVGLN